ncbi:M24 family metallopeptidase [Desulfosporosinus sp. PR]|uniref:M24 family metallopeptidase n=1 Tax=Candidatus Desulfosporosinus nitrosoreducens TaxID=3401928 RepID=UPI0027FB7EA9|nr:M24 family metallopeptidase [Desulfosporosinus sp. PR]MDQ7094823.1 M24 family metallopeptidase [Desulfosporosinus sp. PR]
MMTVARKLARIRKLMAAMELDGVLLRQRRSFSWLTGGKRNYIVTATELGVADVVVLRDQVYCVTTKMEFARIKEEELAGFAWEWMTPEWFEGSEGAISSLCRGKTMGMDVCPELLPEVKGRNISRELAELSFVLDLEEIERYRWLSRSVAEVLEKTCREIEPGMSEFEIQALLASKAAVLGVQTPVLLVAADQRIYAYRHPIPTEKKLERYAMLVLCGEKWGLVANATRFVHFGALSPELQETKQALAEIDLAFNLATRPGVPIKDVFRQGIEAYKKWGHPDDWRYLHQGGPTGYASREFLANLDSLGIVQCHQAFAWNPSLRGLKSEDTLLVTESGPEFLTQTGTWQYLQIEKDGILYSRPDILIR